MQYRADIDGLRAIAVTSVVAYHYGGAVPGGFIGVDVFFVISGFLITGLITREIATGTFSITDFYRRRLRRIAPMLLLVLMVTTVAAGSFLFDAQLSGYSKSLFSTAFFASNFYFWQHSDYFAVPSGSQPLLHTWSLAVEEQFYVIFPLLLVGVARLAASRTKLVLVLTLWLLTLLSFGLAIFLVQSYPAEAFYLLPARAWELGLGALVAIGGVPRVANVWVSHALATVGLAAVLAACVTYSSSTPFPGIRAIPPVFGAALILWTGKDSYVGRLLSLRPLVGIGLVSYSWYLWHWPLIVLYRLYTFRDPGPETLLALGVLSFCLAYLSWRFIETPARHLQLPSRRAVATFAAVPAAFISGVSLTVGPIVGILHPETSAVRTMISWNQAASFPEARNNLCFITSGSGSAHFNAQTCLDRGQSGPNVLLLGDSHAADLYAALRDGLQGSTVLQATASGCLPIVPVSGLARCTTVIDQTLSSLETKPVDTVVVSARWTNDSLSDIDQTLVKLKASSRHVVVVGPAEEYSVDLPDLLARGIVRSDSSLAQAHLDMSKFVLDQRLRSLTEASGATYVSLLDEICPHHVCFSTTDGNTPVMFDTDHYTASGATLVSKGIIAAIQAD